MIEPVVRQILRNVDWGNAVSAEAQTLAQYNTELAILELQTGTILETHGIVFYEEPFASIGPLGRLGPPHCYPAAVVPGENAIRYPSGDQPSEEYFGLEDPVSRDSRADDDADAATDLEEEVEFQKIDEDEEMSDEEIDRLLPPVRSSGLLPDFLRRAFRR